VEVLMLKRIIIPLVILFFLNNAGLILADEMRTGEFLVLTYHAVTEKTSLDSQYSVPRNRFVEQMEYLRTHGYNPVSLADILKASKGEHVLPKNPALLIFDDAYVSYYEFVVPVLEMFGYPSVLAVVGNFIDNPPKDLPEPFMNWGQIKEVSAKKLIEVISQSYDLHKGIQYNPQGNVGPAATVFAYDPNTKKYETEDEYRARLYTDFKLQSEFFSRKLGFVPVAIVWPFGAYNAISQEAAQKAGYIIGFSLEPGLGNINELQVINRVLIENEPMEDFIKKIVKHGKDDLQTPIRAVQVDIDKIYDPTSPEKTDENLGKLINRLVEMKVNTVFLQAFADPEGTGNVKGVYFHNSVLPVKADIFSHAVHQLIIRDMYVYAWLPTLSIVLPDEKLNEELRVREIIDDTARPSQSWYQRLTPFSNDVRRLVRQLYEDLSAHSQIHGILFQDDAYLTDHEDVHPSAISSYKEHFSRDFIFHELEKDPQLLKDWAGYKTDVLIDFTKNLTDGVKKYRPEAKFARNMYASLITEPESEEWFAQNYTKFLKAYDQVVIMAYPQMEKAEKPSPWLKRMVLKAKEFPMGIEKTIFKIQAYDWQKKTWLNDVFLLEELRDILSAGGRHIAYYPDDLWTDRPGLKVMKLEMSTQSYPFMK
jgi:biofilm PGA synthesis lipoprotein PgaB